MQRSERTKGANVKTAWNKSIPEHSEKEEIRDGVRELIGI